MNTPKNNQARNSKDFKAIRQRLLEDDPTCAICGQEANTIDHIRPTDTYENPLDANDPENLRVLCRSCNSRLGARYRNAKHGNPLTQSGRAKPLHTNELFLDTKSAEPPQVLVSVSEPITARVCADGVESSRHYPRLRTNTESGDRSYLGMLESLAEKVLGARLMEWQRVVLGDQLALGPDGRLMFRQSVVSVARQNGKSFALRCLLLFWLLEMPRIRGEAQTVLTTAHRLDLASELFNSLAPILEEHFGAKVIYSYGRQSVTLPAVGDYAGARWLVRAATPSAGHGLSIDLCIVDELFGCSPEAIDDAIMPTMRARRDPLLSCWSTAGTVDESVVFRRMREKGIAEIDTNQTSRLYYAEFSPPGNIDPMSPEAWEYSNPALFDDLSNLEIETIQEESKGANTAAFLRASVNLWITGHRSWLDQGYFETLATAGDLPKEGGVLAIEASADDHRFVGVRAVDDGNHVRCTVEFITDNLRDLWKKVDQAKQEHKGLKIACGASLDLHLPPNIKGASTLVGQREIQKWTTLVRSMIVSGQVLHTGEQLLIEQVNRAVLSKHQGQIAVSTARSAGPIELCRALIWAVAMAGKPKAQTNAAFAFAD